METYWFNGNKLSALIIHYYFVNDCILWFFHPIKKSHCHSKLLSKLNPFPSPLCVCLFLKKKKKLSSKLGKNSFNRITYGIGVNWNTSGWLCQWNYSDIWYKVFFQFLPQKKKYFSKIFLFNKKTKKREYDLSFHKNKWILNMSE